MLCYLPAIRPATAFLKAVYCVGGRQGRAGGALLTRMSCAVGDSPESVVAAGGSWSGQWQCPKAGGSGSCLHLDSPTCLGLGQVTRSSLGSDTAEGEAQAVGKAWWMKGKGVSAVKLQEVAGEERSQVRGQAAGSMGHVDIKVTRKRQGSGTGRQGPGARHQNVGGG